jgi:hypothetical protein
VLRKKFDLEESAKKGELTDKIRGIERRQKNLGASPAALEQF